MLPNVPWQAMSPSAESQGHKRNLSAHVVGWKESSKGKAKPFCPEIVIPALTGQEDLEIGAALEWKKLSPLGRKRVF